MFLRFNITRSHLTEKVTDGKFNKQREDRHYWLYLNALGFMSHFIDKKKSVNLVVEHSFIKMRNKCINEFIFTYEFMSFKG